MNRTNYKNLIQELQAEYLASFDEKYKTLKTAYEGQDWHTLELEFHKLKGTGSTYGLPEITTLCEHLERVCRRQQSLSEADLKGALQLMERIRLKYRDGKSFNLESDPLFQKLKSLE